MDVLPKQCFVGNLPLAISYFNCIEAINVPEFDRSGTDAGINFCKAVIKRHKLGQKILKQIR